VILGINGKNEALFGSLNPREKMIDEVSTIMVFEIWFSCISLEGS